ncbi:MAG: S8 family serine peptidase, partial [Gemmatimonadales bacterium]
MPEAPERYRHPSGHVLIREPEYVLVGLHRPMAAQGFAKLLSALGPTVEPLRSPIAPSDPDDEQPAPIELLSTTPRRHWVRAEPSFGDPERAGLARLVGLNLDFVGAAYRLPGSLGLAGVVCPVPNLVAVRIRPGEEAAWEARVAAGQWPLEESTGQSALTGGALRVYRLRSYDLGTAIDLRDALERQHGDLVASAHLEHLPLVRPTAFIPNEASGSYYASQWHLTAVGAEAAWDLSQGDPKVFVCVIDDGVRLDHPDLQPNLPSHGVDIGDPTADADVADPSLEFHGTQVAGAAAARLDNGTGIAALAGRCSIYPIKCDLSDLHCALAIEHAALFASAAPGRRGVINLSFGWAESELPLIDVPLIDTSIVTAHSKNCLIVAAVGNGGSADPTHNFYPSRHPRVMACGAMDKADTRWQDFFGESHYGTDAHAGETTGVSVVAPGVGIWSTVVGSNDYGIFSMTSSSTPQVAALAALLVAKYGLSADETREVIERTAVKVNATGAGAYSYLDDPAFPNGRRHKEVGYGRIDARQALDFADVMIRDWAQDDGVEPSSPPNGVFWATSDIVVRPTDDGVFLPDQPLEASRVTRGQDNWLYVRVQNRGPADARAIVVSVRIVAWAGVAFGYPLDWTLSDATHLAPDAVTPSGPAAQPFKASQLAAGQELIAKFRITAAQVDQAWGWQQGNQWHPCILAAVSTANDYAWQTVSTSNPGLLTRRNNLAQRNVSVIELAAGSSSALPVVLGHGIDDGQVDHLVIAASGRSRSWRLELELEPGRDAFPAALAEAGLGTGRVGRVISDLGRVARGDDGRRVVRLEHRVTRVRLERPPRGTCLVALRATA